MTQSSFVTNFTFDIEKSLWPSKPSHGLTPIYPRKLLKVMWKSPLINTYRKWFVCLFLGLKGENLPLYRLWIINVPHAFCPMRILGGSPVSKHASRYRTLLFKNKSLEKTGLFRIISCAIDITLPTGNLSCFSETWKSSQLVEEQDVRNYVFCSSFNFSIRSK